MQTTADIPPVISSWQREGLAPVAARERTEIIDVLRGCALFGILTVNMAWFSWPMEQVMMNRDFWESRMDRIADGVVRLLAEGKFYPLFSLLFGLGVAIQMERAESHGRGFAGWYCRRLLVLLGIGLAHAILVWEGDILVWYAVCGFLLLPFRKRKPKTLLIWAAVCLLIPALLILAFGALLVAASFVPETAKLIEEAMTQNPEAAALELEENIRLVAHGSYGEILSARIGALAFMWLVGLFFAPTFLAMFLIGLYAGRRSLFQDFDVNIALFRRVLIWGLALGVPANLIYVIGTELTNLPNGYFLWLPCFAAVTLGGPALSLAYAAAITLLSRNDAWKRWLRPIATAGRMALTNYLLQSLICTTLFYSYGLGLFGSVGRAAGLGLAVAIFAMQVCFSIWWLKRFQFGPMEWLWRTMTYGKRQPMRR